MESRGHKGSFGKAQRWWEGEMYGRAEEEELSCWRPGGVVGLVAVELVRSLTVT